MATSALRVGAALAACALLLTCAGASEIVFGRQLLQAETFPPNCTCVRDNRESPYRLTVGPPATENGFVQYCFTVVNIGGCDPKLTCCNGQQGVEKVEFDVEVDCKGSLKRVTVDGVPKSFEYNTKLKVLRITKLGLTAETAPGTKICLLLQADSTCPSLSQMCSAPGDACKYAIFNQDRDCCPVSIVGGALPPPPPFTPAFANTPPPPPGAFPHCNCIAQPAASKLSTYISEVTTVGSLTKACFKVNVTSSCLLGSSCCEFSLFKFELEANPSCGSSLVYSTLDGARRVRFFQANPYPVIKVTNIDKPFSTVDGTEICLFLRPPCDSLESLCPNGQCQVALFNPRASRPSCCPITVLSP